MAIYTFANNVSTTLASPISSSATTIPLSSSTNLPVLASGDTFACTLNDAATQSVYEIVYASGISGANLTGCTRGAEGTTAVSWLANDLAFSAVTAGQLANFQQITLPVIGNPYEYANVHADSIASFTTITKINTTPCTIPAGALTVGAVVTVKAVGNYGFTGSPTYELYIKLGGQTIIEQIFAAGGSGPYAWQFKWSGVVSTTGSSGTFAALQGFGSAQTSSVGYLIQTGLSPSVNTTINNAVNLYATCTASSASNSITMVAWSVEIAYPSTVVT
jgi:hypothetical protein